jgi:pyruvate-formate lyase-activating enzyme
MANIGYIQMVRHCNQNCGFCSNPETPFFHDLDQVRTIVDDFRARDYFGVIMTGACATTDLPSSGCSTRRGNRWRMRTVSRA